MRLSKSEMVTVPSLSSLQQWFDSEPGQVVLEVERNLLRPLLSNCFGYHLLQLGADPRHCLYSDSRVRRKLRAGPEPITAALSVCCGYDALPFASDSLDVVIIHHVLEFAANPHGVLRELQRITVPGGRVFVLAFNPWSLHGLRSLYGRMSGRGHWQNRYLPARRVADWMQLLGFDTAPAAYGLHRPPWAMTRLLPRRAAAHTWQQHWPGGSVYLISGVKQIAPLTPVRPRWAPASAIGLPVARPSVGRHAACVSREPDRQSPAPTHPVDAMEHH